MHKIKRLFVLLLGLSITTAGCAPSSYEQTENSTVLTTEKPNTQDIVNKLVSARVENDKSLEETKLEELERTDDRQADAWSQIMSFWSKTNKPDFVNMDILPDGLPDDDSFCIVVLGYQLNADGSMRPELVSRLQTAKECAEKYPNAYVLVTGGGTAMNSQNTEADCMAEWLIENDIDKQRIIVENKSLTSAENALYSYDILINSYPSISGIAIVTSDYHVPLGCQLFYAQFKLGECIKGNRELKVISNAAYNMNSENVFTQSSQAAWILNLYNRNNR